VTRRILAPLTVVVALLLGGPFATPALADFHVLRSTPAAGSTVPAPPGEVRITLDQPVNDVASTVQVNASDGLYNSGVVRVEDGNTLVQPVRRMPAGAYTVGWTAAAAPGAPTTSGKFSFTVATPSEPPAGPGQWIIIGVLAVIAAALGSALVRRRADRRNARI
jgi:methionine-rich copper-binding protein CopC